LTDASRKSEFLRGSKDTFPLVVGAVPFGIIFGAVAITTGFSTWGTLGMSALVFAGSAQFIAIGLVAQGVALGFIVLTTFAVNLRHALYAASLGVYMRHLPQRWLALLGFWLTDETYAVVIRRYSESDDSPYKHWYCLGSAAFMYCNWQLCTLIGIVMGRRLRDLPDLGLDYAMVITFIGIVVPFIVNRPMLLCAMVSGAVSMFTTDVPNKMGLMVAAVCGIAAGLIAEWWSRKNRQSDSEADRI
jgi:4-azaleucine resistance transporter AzlC